jgi:putative endonuclease
MWHVYVLISQSSGKLYVGMTQHLDRRIIEHNSGKGKFTSGQLPWELVYSEQVSDSKKARAREKYLKSAAGKRHLRTLLGGAGSLPD